MHVRYQAALHPDEADIYPRRRRESTLYGKFLQEKAILWKTNSGLTTPALAGRLLPCVAVMPGSFFHPSNAGKP